MEESSPSEAPGAPAIFSELRVDVGFIPNLDPVVDFPIANQFANRTAIGTEVHKFTADLTFLIRNGDSVNQTQSKGVRAPSVMESTFPPKGSISRIKESLD